MTAAEPRLHVLIPTAHGAMLVNRMEAQFPFGVGKELLEQGVYSPGEIELLRRIGQVLGPQAVHWDIGANLGVHTLELSRLGRWVVAYEPQRVIFQLLCANLALNSRLNVDARQAACGAAAGCIQVPAVRYDQPGSYGSLELRPVSDERMGQVDRSQGEAVPLVRLDEAGHPPPDFVKIDVEGMELEVLTGAAQAIAARRPVLMVEHIKCDRAALLRWLTDRGYQVYAPPAAPLNWLARHADNPSLVVSGLPTVAAG